MNILNYFFKIKTEINNIDSFISSPEHDIDKYNPFFNLHPKTYVWIENEKN